MTAPLTNTDVPPAEAAVQRLVQRLGEALTELRAAHLVSVRLAWRQLPLAQTRSAGLALAAEAAGFEGRFWALHSRLLELHRDPVDVHAAARRAGVDRDRLLALMTLDAAADRVVFDVESALAGGFRTTPTVFVNGEWFTGSLEGEAIWAAGTPW